MERGKAVEYLDEIQKTAKNSLDKTAWTQKVLDGDMFQAVGTSKEEDRMSAETAGFMTREQFEQKRLEIENDKQETEANAAAVQEEKEKEERRKEKKRKRVKEKERQKSKSMLSFEEDE